MQAKLPVAVMRRLKWLIACGILLCLVLLLWNGNRTHHTTLPEKIFHLERIKIVSGDSARSIVDDLHENELAPNNSVVAYYTSPDGGGTLYVSRYDHAENASRDVDRMALKIQKGSISGFSGFRKIEIEKIPVYILRGMGQVHYFFSYGNEVFWFSLDIPVAQSTMTNFVRYLKKQ